MVAVAALTPERIAAGRSRRGRFTLLVAPGVGGAELVRGLAGRWGVAPPASLHVVAVDSSRDLWSTWAEWDLCLVGGVWDLYEESWVSQRRARAERLADLEANLAHLAPAATFETLVGALRSALLQAPLRWPGSTVVVVSRRRTLPWRLRRWPDGIELLSL